MDEGLVDAASVRAGDMVEVLRGTPVSGTHPRRSRWVAARALSVVVTHVGPGIGAPRDGEPHGAPSAFWLGSGGYLCCADLRDVRAVAVGARPRRG